MSGLTAGAAKTVLTPKENLRLAGYSATSNLLLMPFRHRLASGVHDDIHARCLALSDGQTLLALLALDLIGLFHNDVEAIRRRAREKTGRDDLSIIVASTHTHSVPDTYGAYGGVPRWYREFIHQQAGEAVAEAVRRLVPARIGFASGRAEGLFVNHRRPQEGPADDAVGLMLVEGAGGGTIALLVNAACHANILGQRNTLVSADFPGYLCQELERARGGMALFFNGAQGDLFPHQTIDDPEDEKGLRDFAQAEALGHALAEKVLAALAQVQTKADVSIEVRRTTPELPVTNTLLKVLRWMRVVKRKLYHGRVRTEAWVVTIDDAEIATIPGQAFCRLGLELKGQMKAAHRFIFGLANDELAYLLPPEEWDPKRKAEEEAVSLGRGAWPAYREQMPPL